MAASGLHDLKRSIDALAGDGIITVGTLFTGGNVAKHSMNSMSKSFMNILDVRCEFKDEYLVEHDPVEVAGVVVVQDGRGQGGWSGLVRIAASR